jgi:uncharacterized integral membrane protein
MRTVIAFVVGIATAAVVVGLGVLVVQNTQSEQLTFLGMTLFVDKGGVVAGAVALGFVLAVLLLLPGRLASAWHRAQVHRQTQTLEQRLVALREEHARLHGGHQRLVEEHGLVLDRVLPSPRFSLPPHAAQTPQTSLPAGDGVPAAAPAAAAATAQPTGAPAR